MNETFLYLLNSVNKNAVVTNAVNRTAQTFELFSFFSFFFLFFTFVLLYKLFLILRTHLPIGGPMLLPIAHFIVIEVANETINDVYNISFSS